MQLEVTPLVPTSPTPRNESRPVFATFCGTAAISTAHHILQQPIGAVDAALIGYIGRQRSCV